VEYDSNCSKGVRYFVKSWRVAGVKRIVGFCGGFGIGFGDEEWDRRPLGGRILVGSSWIGRLSATDQSDRSEREGIRETKQQTSRKRETKTIVAAGVCS
jgi:hypothetical protein